MKNISLLKNYLLYRNRFRKVGNRINGFTLVELLVTIIIGSLIVSSVTALLVDVVRANQQEKVRIATQQDMEQALDFIESDLKKATYVYTGDQIHDQRKNGNIETVKKRLDITITNPDNVVLAFWKPERIPYTSGGGEVPLQCDDGSGGLNSNLNSSDTTLEECEDLQVERRTYTLVVYLQDTNPSNTWSGNSVIRRYELRKYDNGDTYTSNGEDYLKLSVNEGYVDPVKEADGFRNWPYDQNNNSLVSSNKPVIDGNSSPVLVDFVDDPSNDTGNLPTCLQEPDSNNNDELESGEDTNGNGVRDIYSRTPKVSTSKSFFACVRQSRLDGEFSQGNQDVILYLRGNPDGRSGFENNSNSFTPLPTLQTQVLLRGVVDKFFDN